MAGLNVPPWRSTGLIVYTLIYNHGRGWSTSNKILKQFIINYVNHQYLRKISLAVYIFFFRRAKVL